MAEGSTAVLAAISRADGPLRRAGGASCTQISQQENRRRCTACAPWLCHLLRGEPLWETGLKARRAALRETAAACAPPQQAEELFHLLDRGLRLEPSRRYPSVADLLATADSLEARMNEAARDTWMIRGAVGFLPGRSSCRSCPRSWAASRGAARSSFRPRRRGSAVSTAAWHTTGAACW